MSFIARSATRIGQSVKTSQQVRRQMSGTAHHDIPGHDVRKEFAAGIGLALVGAFAWKSWQWNNKAERVSNNNKWEKQYPQYVADRRAALAAAAADAEVEELTEQPPNEERPESEDAHNNPDTQQPKPTEKKEPGKVIPSKKNQNDL